MSGHSKWHNIAAKKGKADAARGKIFTKLGREILVAVKSGGPDPVSNSKLKDVIAKCKANNMPNDTINNAIKKASGAGNNENYEEIIRTYNNLKKELNDLEDDLIKQEIELNKIKDDLEDDELFKNYEEAKTFYEEFHHEHEKIKEKQSDRFELKDEDIKELKIMWKKACRLCHPDIVTDELKEKANEIMQSLNHAYSRRDINKVKQILLNLENGLVFEVSSDKIDNKEILKSKIEEFRQSIIHIQEEIENIKSDDTFKTISNLENWDEYFEELKNELKVEEKRLEDESKIILEENT